MRYWLDRAPAVSEALPGDTVTVTSLFDDARGCRKFAQRALAFAPGSSRERIAAGDDEILYVLRGTAALAVGDAQVEVGPATGVFVGRGTPWSVVTAEPLELVSVLVHDPEPAAPGLYGLVDLGGADRRSATASRQFTLGVTPQVGCRSATQFIGYIPPGRAPDHFHRYDEVIYVLDGSGTLHIGGEQAPLGPGACVHLPATLVHSLENTGEQELALLGVFRPAGSPAEAYYPDGTPAAYPEE
jgi:mannose-6-phosphate isomerase-like protein (cupin superfamily)